MLKVMVVDDEPWGRKSVSKMIGELGLDVEVVAEARNGAEALELIPISRPQIVVTDMNMPVMNGQLFLETLYNRHNEIKVIVISGHSQFEYMKAAVAYQACEYVLKPVSLADLKNAMVKAIGASRDHLSAHDRRKLSTEMRKLRIELFLQHVTSRRIANAADIALQSEELQFSQAASGYRLAVCMLRRFQELSATKFHSNSDLLMYSLENILCEMIGDDRLLVFKSDDRSKLCVLIPDSSNDVLRFGELLAPFHDAVSRILHSSVVAGLSSVRERLDQLPEAFEEAIDRLLENPLLETGFSIHTENSVREADDANLLGAFDIKLLQQALSAGQAGAAKRLLMEFLQKLTTSGRLTIRGGQKELHRLSGIVAREWKEIANNRPDLFDPRAINGIVSDSGLRMFVEALAAVIEEQAGKKANAEAAHPIREIAAYLDGYYFEDVSLIDIATRHHMDPSYLSKQFKAVTGENFIEYITRKRMEKACELLRSSDKKINDISELVGYENQRYFSQVFKKFTGYTPSEYRESSPDTSP